MLATSNKQGHVTQLEFSKLVRCYLKQLGHTDDCAITICSFLTSEMFVLTVTQIQLIIIIAFYEWKENKSFPTKY